MRIAYATSVFGVLAFFVIYFGRPIVYLGGPGTVSSPRHVISPPYTVQVIRMAVMSGHDVKAREEIGEVRSPEVDNLVATYMRTLLIPCTSRAKGQRKRYSFIYGTCLLVSALAFFTTEAQVRIREPVQMFLKRTPRPTGLRQYTQFGLYLCLIR